MTSEFRTIAPNVVASDEGEVLVARVGLDVTFRGRRYAVDSEMLAPPMSIAVFFRTSPAALADDAEQIREFITAALAFRGFRVELA